MRYYFKAGLSDSISKRQFYDYQSYTIGLILLMLYFSPLVERSVILLMLAGASFGLCFYYSGTGIYRQIKEEQSCNIYDAIRCGLSLVLALFSLFFPLMFE